LGNNLWQIISALPDASAQEFFDSDRVVNIRSTEKLKYYSYLLSYLSFNLWSFLQVEMDKKEISNIETYMSTG
jgi:hypothetical protein